MDRAPTMFSRLQPTCGRDVLHLTRGGFRQILGDKAAHAANTARHMMNKQSRFTEWLHRSGWAILLIAAVQFVLHLWANSHDGIFRDELYYVAAGQHLSAGYVEYPPFVALAAAFSKAVFGTS